MLELREGRNDVELEAAGGGREVELLAEGNELNVRSLDLFQHGDKIGERPAEPVEPPHRHDVQFPGKNSFE